MWQIMFLLPPHSLGVLGVGPFLPYNKDYFLQPPPPMDSNNDASAREAGKTTVGTASLPDSHRNNMLLSFWPDLKEWKNVGSTVVKSVNVCFLGPLRGFSQANVAHSTSQSWSSYFGVISQRFRTVAESPEFHVRDNYSSELSSTRRCRHVHTACNNTGISSNMELFYFSFQRAPVHGREETLQTKGQR